MFAFKGDQKLNGTPYSPNLQRDGEYQNHTYEQLSRGHNDVPAPPQALGVKSKSARIAKAFMTIHELWIES